LRTGGKRKRPQHQPSGAEQLSREEDSITALAYVARGVTEKKWYNEHLAWVKERCHGKRDYLLGESTFSPSKPKALIPPA
jgi:hypothetical protein